MNKTYWMLTLTVATTALLAACGDDSGTGDDDDDGLALPNLPLAQVGTNEDEDDEIDPGGTNADFSCLGMALEVGDEVTATINVANGLDRDDVNANTEIIFLEDNTYQQGTCTSPDTTDGNGDFTITAAEGDLVGIRLCPTAESGFAESVQYNLVVDPDEAAEASSATSSTLRLLPLTVGADPVSGGNGIVSGALEDCSGNDVYGVAVRFFDAEGNPFRDGRNRFSLRYFDGIDEGSPTQGRDFTHVDGRYSGINLPGDQDVLVGVYGRREADDDPVLLSCERFFTIASPNADNPNITILTSRPLRDDSPTGCPEPEEMMEEM